MKKKLHFVRRPGKWASVFSSRITNISDVHITKISDARIPKIGDTTYYFPPYLCAGIQSVGTYSDNILFTF